MQVIILLTGETEFPYLRDMVKEHNPDANILHAGTGRNLADRLDTLNGSPARLIAFCTDVIVPARQLQRLEGNCYNIHPAPPEYPGYQPGGFALYEGATEFGATAHVMTEDIDGGPIVGCSRFQIKDDWTHEDLSLAAYSAAIRLFQELAPAFARTGTALPHLDLSWGRHVYTRKDHQAMKALGRDLPHAEVERRLRAFSGVYTPLS